MTQLLVGTKKGLFVLEGGGAEFEITSRHFAGEPVEFATRDARTGRTFACVTSAFYGPKIFYTDDLRAEWQQAVGVELPEDADKPLERVQYLGDGRAVELELALSPRELRQGSPKPYDRHGSILERITA